MAKHRRHEMKMKMKMEKSGSMDEPKRIEGMPESMAAREPMDSMGRKYYGEGYGMQANMPTTPDMALYPRPYRTLEAEAYPDNIREIDTDAMANLKQVHQYMSDSMY